MCHKLLLTHLGRRPQDDRDHFANKRMDMAGALLGQLFRQLFYGLTKLTNKLIRQKVQSKKLDFNLLAMVDPKMVGRGLKYSLATGNWGSRSAGPPSKTGVSQVRASSGRTVLVWMSRTDQYSIATLVLERRLLHPGAEPPLVRVHAVSLAPPQHAAGQDGQERQAASAAQHALGHGVSGRDARGSRVRPRQEPVAHVVHHRRHLGRHRHCVSERRGSRVARGHWAGARAQRHQGVCQWRVARHSPQPGGARRPHSAVPTRVHAAVRHVGDLGHSRYGFWRGDAGPLVDGIAAQPEGGR